MKQLRAGFIALLLFIGYGEAFAQASVPSSDVILDSAYSVSEKTGKPVFLIFHASWCVWCRKMDTAMNDPSTKLLFYNNYVITHLVVHESKNKKHLENAGSLEVLNRYGGDNHGIPYWVILDSKGKRLADAQIRPPGSDFDVKGKNSGCPATAEEINHFLNVLKETSSLTDGQLEVINKRFSAINAGL